MEADQRIRVRSWFLGLSPADRAAAITAHDQTGVDALREMHAAKVRSGDCLFYADDDDLAPAASLGGVRRSRRRASAAPPSVSARRLSGGVCSRRTDELMHPTEEAREADLRLEQGLRLCDTERYLDTLTVAPEWLSTPARARDFVRTMEVVSHGGFLREACSVRWDEARRAWAWGAPRWFQDMGFHSLAAYAAARLERALWAYYYEAHSLDPRAVGEKRAFGPRRRDGSGAGSLRSALDPLRTGLRAFWRELPLPERKRLVEERLGKLVGEILREDFPDTPGLIGSFLDMSAGVHGHEQVLSFSSEVLFSSDAFVEFVYLSPIARAGTPVDRLLRKVCHRIQCACSERMALELMNADALAVEEKESGGRQSKGRRKKKKARAAVDSNAARSVSANATADDAAAPPDPPGGSEGKSRRNSDGGAPAFLDRVDEESSAASGPEGARVGPSRRRRLHSEGTDVGSDEPFVAVPSPAKEAARESRVAGAGKGDASKQSAHVPSALANGPSHGPAVLLPEGAGPVPTKQAWVDIADSPRRDAPPLRAQQGSSPQGSPSHKPPPAPRSVQEGLGEGRRAGSDRVVRRLATPAAVPGTSRDADDALTSLAPPRAQRPSASKSEGEEEDEEEGQWQVVRWSSERRLAQPRGRSSARGRTGSRGGSTASSSGRSSPFGDGGGSHVPATHGRELRRSHSQSGGPAGVLPMKAASSGGTPAERPVPLERRNSAPTRQGVGIIAARPPQSPAVPTTPVRPSSLAISARPPAPTVAPATARPPPHPQLPSRAGNAWLNGKPSALRRPDETDSKDGVVPSDAGFVPAAVEEQRAPKTKATSRVAKSESPRVQSATVTLPPPPGDFSLDGEPFLFATPALAGAAVTSLLGLGGAADAPVFGAHPLQVLPTASHAPSPTAADAPWAATATDASRQPNWDAPNRLERRRSFGEADRPPSNPDTQGAKRRAGSVDDDEHMRQSRVSVRSAPPSPHPTAFVEQRSSIAHPRPAQLAPLAVPIPPDAYVFGDDPTGREMLDFMKEVLRSENVAVRGDIVVRVQQVVRALWPEARVEVYGSVATGLALPTSDLDLVICRIGPYVGPAAPGAAPSLEPLIAQLMAALKALPWCTNVRSITTARVPVVKCTAFPDAARRGGVLVDITFGTGAMHRGVAARDYLRGRLTVCSALLPLLFVLKEYLRIRGLNDVYEGGLGSYSLAVMAIYYVKLRSPLPTLGKLLVDFLNFYAAFDFTRYGISVGEESPRALPEPVSHGIVIDDPATPGANVGGGSFLMMRVQSAFAEAAHLLMAPRVPPQRAGGMLPLENRVKRLLNEDTWREGAATMEFESRWPRGRVHASVPSSKRSRSTDDALTRERQA